jgi:hypothetical protein
MAGSTVSERMRTGGIVMDPALVVKEAKAAGIRLALACALLEQESGGGHNIFGHDRDPKTRQLIFPARDGTVPVTKELYHEYLKHRKATGLCQGVGPTQLTFFALQDQADKAGGCWKPEVNLRVGLQHLGSLVKAGGELSGLTSYNGSVEYARTVLGLAAKWEARLVLWLGSSATYRCRDQAARLVVQSLARVSSWLRSARVNFHSNGVAICS